MMERFDVNKDGVIDDDDIQKRKESRFSKIDSNGDGVVSRDEIAEARNARREKRKAKRSERSERAFARRDKDGDGVLSREEFDAPRQKSKREHYRAGSKKGDKHKAGKGKSRKRGHNQRNRGERLMKKADLNGDGKITRAELQTTLETRHKQHHSDR